VDQDGKAIKARSLKANHNTSSTTQSTPCFLLNLGKAVSANVKPATEAGKPRLAAAVSAATRQSSPAPHLRAQLAYPTRQVSFIGFRAAASPANARGQVITCCADKSVYDPLAGARVLSGPAPQPLAAVLLEHDAATDELYAVGTLGSEKFNEFFQKYDFKLTMEMGGRARDAVTGTAKLVDLASYSNQTAQC
jgi:Rieske Fe-S protein